MKKTFLIALSGILLLSSSNPGRKKDAESRRILKNQDTAYIYNFSVDGLNYINDFTENVTYDDNSKGVIAYYNYTQLWTGFYNYYSSATDTMYYFVLARNLMHTNSASIQNGYFRIVSRSCNIGFKAQKYYSTQVDNSNLSLLKYAPESYGDSTSTTGTSFTIGVSFSAGTKGVNFGASCSAGLSNGVTSTNVILKPTSLNDSTKKIFRCDFGI